MNAVVLRAYAADQTPYDPTPTDAEVLKRLRIQLRDLRTSIQHRRHHDDLLNEIDDILYGLQP